MYTYANLLKAINPDKNLATLAEFGILEDIKGLTDKNGNFVKPKFLLFWVLNPRRFKTVSENLEAKIFNIEMATISGEVSAQDLNAGFMFSLIRCLAPLKIERNWRAYVSAGICIYYAIIKLIDESKEK